MKPFEATDEATNLIMDYHVRPLIQSYGEDLDDEIYTYVHKQVQELIKNTKQALENL